MRLRVRLFLLVLIAVLPALAIQIYNEIELRRERVDEVHEPALRHARAIAAGALEILEGSRQLLAALSHLADEERGGLGLKLVQTLAAPQLQGTFSATSSRQGATFIVPAPLMRGQGAIDRWEGQDRLARTLAQPACSVRVEEQIENSFARRPGQDPGYSMIALNEGCGHERHNKGLRRVIDVVSSCGCAMRSFPALAGAVLLLMGACTQTQWVHPTADAATAAADRAECDNTARIQALEQVQFESLPRRSVLRGGMIGYPRAGSSFPERNSEWYWTQHFHDRCMQAKGYRLREVK